MLQYGELFNMNFKQGDLENVIINAIWSIEENTGEPIDVAYIRNYINLNSSSQKWAYTTVKTVMDRLADKKLIERIKINRKYLYKSIMLREEAALLALKKLSRQYFNGNLQSVVEMAEKVLESESLALRKRQM